MDDEIARRNFLLALGGAASVPSEALSGSAIANRSAATNETISELTLAALRAQGFFDNIHGGSTPPAKDKLWLDTNKLVAVLKEWDHTVSTWVPLTFERLFGRAIVTSFSMPTGTANALVVTVPGPLLPHRMYSLRPVIDNNGAATLEVAGVGTYNINYSDGTNIDAQELKAGNPTVLLFTGKRFEVIFTVSPVYIASDTAVAAAASVNIQNAIDRAALKALNPSLTTLAALRESYREGIFSWKTGDFKTLISTDMLEGIYIKADAVDSSLGAWVRQYNGNIFPEWFGATGDGTTSDQAAAAATVAFASVAGNFVEWTNIYLTTESIPKFHSARHLGPGVIKRGVDIFAVAPKEGQINILYVVAEGGSSSNDGLSSSHAISSLQGAFNIFSSYWPLNGSWVVKLAAGTYAASGNRAARLGPANDDETNPNVDSYAFSSMSTRNAIIIEGPDVGYDPALNPTPTPTAIFDGRGAASIGIQLEGGQNIVAKNLKFQNYNGSSSSAGISADTWTLIRTENVHCHSCSVGINAVNHSRLEVRGGTISACETGIRAIFNVKHEIGNQRASKTGQGPFITHCTAAGFLSQEGSTGHSDFVSYADNALGVDVQVNARVNLNGSDFKRNTVGVRVGDGNVFPVGVIWNTGTANSNTENLRLTEGAVIAAQNSGSWRTLDRSTTTFSTVRSTGVQTAYSVNLAADLYTSVPSSIYRGKAFRYRCIGTIAGTSGTKAFHMRLGGKLVVGAQIEADALGGFEVEGHIYLTGNATQKSTIRVIAGSGMNRTKSGYAPTAINTALPKPLAFTGTVQLGDPADTIVVEIVELEVQG